MKSGLEVFDFKEEDELAEVAAGKYLSKFKNPSLDNSSILKYQFLECVAQGSEVPKKKIGCLPCGDVDAIQSERSDVPKEDAGDLPCVDIDAMESDCRHHDVITYDALETVREEVAAKEGNPGLDTASLLISPSHENDPSLKLDNYDTKSSVTESEARVSCHVAPSPKRSQLNFALSDSPSSSEPVADDSIYESCPSSPNIANAFSNGHASRNHFGDSEMDEIIIAADYVVYRNNCCPCCLVTFSSNGIKINGLYAYEDEEIFSFEKGIDDMVRIESQHFQRFATVVIKFKILSKNSVKVDDAHDTSEGIETLEISVVEPNWSRKWEEISSLNVKYLALWRDVDEADVTMDGGSDSILQRPYFPEFDEAFEDVVYPKGDSDAVSISKRDVDRLQPETFINDTIIDFYIKYLKNQISPDEKHRFHFFNSFFFRKLADLDKDPSSASDGRAAFLRVHKWTRKVDIFGKDYVFIPVNFNLHWSLLVICHPGEVAGLKDEDSEKPLRVPCVLHMDSIKGTHAGLQNLVQSYLWEEWKARHKDMSEELSSKFLNLRFVSLELPQQENSFDCGLFLLHYLELFLVDAPLNFNPFEINKFSKFVNVDWFPPVEASLKRTLIQRLISDLLEKRSREVSTGDVPISSCCEKIEKQTRVEFVSERYSPALASHVNLSNSEAGHGIEITLLEAASLRNSQCLHDPMVLRELLEPGVAGGSLLAQCSSLDHSSYYRLNDSMSQDDAETGEQFVYFTGATGFQQMNVITPEASSIPYSFRGIGADASWNPGLPTQERNSSSESSSCPSDESDVGIIENHSVDDAGLCLKEKADDCSSPYVENIKCLTEKVASASSKMLENSPDKMPYSNENDDLASCQEIHADSSVVENRSHQNVEKVDTTDDMQNAEKADITDDLQNAEKTDTTDDMQNAKKADTTDDMQNAEKADTTDDVQNAEKTDTTDDMQNAKKADTTDDMQKMDSDLTAEMSEQKAAKRPRLTHPLEV